MAADHEDYETGAAPAAHKLSHQDGGTDEISVAGLSGETAALAAHKILPTVHQDAPGLIETHRLVAGAHHAKYTDAEVRAVFNPISISPVSFRPRRETYKWDAYQTYVKNITDLTEQEYFALLFLPHGVTVTKLTLYGFRNDAASSMELSLIRNNRSGVVVTMSTVVSDWTTGYSSLYDDTINSPIVDNGNYDYCLGLSLDPNDNVWDCALTGAKIEFTG